ncbi:MAG: hypothetical protein KJ041_08405, partial [Gammaproteobacteria bacterium]|nr:hypothetical protein [Gammaproteobacteria bacterium]
MQRTRDLARCALTLLLWGAGSALAADAPAARKPDFSPPPPAVAAGQELPMREIPNIPSAAEAYYAPDDYHIIAQTKDPEAQQPEPGKVGGAATWIFT